MTLSLGRQVENTESLHTKSWRISHLLRETAFSARRHVGFISDGR